MSTSSRDASRLPTRCSERLSNYCMDSAWSKVKVGSEANTALSQSPIRKIKSVSLSSSTVKPDPPKNLQLKPLKNSRQVEVSWEYPDTWSTPHSYFSLTFCIQVQGKSKREKKDKLFMDETSAKVTCHKDAQIRVQARDRYYSSSWSEWTSVSCS